MGRAYILETAKQWQEAADLFDKVSNLLPEDIKVGLRAREEAGWCQFHSGELRSAIAVLQGVLDSLKAVEEDRSLECSRLLFVEICVNLCHTRHQDRAKEGGEESRKETKRRKSKGKKRAKGIEKEKENRKEIEYAHIRFLPTLSANHPNTSCPRSVPIEVAALREPDSLLLGNSTSSEWGTRRRLVKRVGSAWEVSGSERAEDGGERGRDERKDGG